MNGKGGSANGAAAPGRGPMTKSRPGVCQRILSGLKTFESLIDNAVVETNPLLCHS